jgi:hypothetical protein
MRNIIGFWGYPKPSLIEKYKNLYPAAEWVDLDIDFNYPKTAILPENYCSIIKNIFNNAFYLKENLITILAPVGKDKCDSAFFAVHILKEQGFNIETSYFEEVLPLDKLPKTPISISNLPLKEKIEKITANIIEEKDYSYLPESKPQFGFWGVPPNDLSILEIFPDNTHVFGWTRCVEAKNPGNIELEMLVEKDLPTVFFAQTFCAKNQLAKYLANEYNGLYIDIDGTPTNSIKAKIEAFLRLR